MTLRSFLARAVLALLCALQFVILAGFLTLFLAQSDTPDLAALLQRSLGSATPAIAVAATAAILPGTLAAMALWRMRLSGLAAGFLLAPLLLPMALFSFGDDASGQVAFLLAHAALGMGLGTLCGIACLAWLDLGVLRAAACCGVSPWGALRRVVLPVMAPGILAAALLAATISLGAAMTRAGLGLHTLAVALPPHPKILLMAAAGLAVVLAAVTSVVLVLLRRP